MSAPRLSVVIPAYREEGRIGPALERIAGYLRGRGEDFEVVVVDDGSDDRTLEVVRDATGDDPAVRVLAHERNRGKGAAVQTGMREARGALRLFSDADLSTPIEELVKLEAAIEGGADIAVGSRAVSGSDVRVHQHALRESLGRTFNGLVRAVTGLPVLDTQCGFKLFRAAAAEQAFAVLDTPGWAFDVEVLLRARRAGLAIAEVPVVWYNDDRSHVNTMVDGTRMAVDVLRIAWKLRREGR